MKEPFDDQWEEQLRQAVCEAGDLLDAGFPVEDPHPHDFSHDFEQSMDHLLHRRRHRPAFRQVGRVACAVLLLLVGSVSFLPSSTQAWESLCNWASERSNDAQRYFHVGDVISSDAIVHYQIDIPEGYTLHEDIDGINTFHRLYMNDSNKYIDFSYLYETESSHGEVFVMDSEADAYSVTVNGNPATLYLSHDPEASNTLIWADRETGALIDVTAFMGKDDLIALAETVTPIRE